MSSLFSSPKSPPPATPAPLIAPAPTQTSDVVQAAADAERLRRAQAGGRSSTLLTAPDSTAAPSAGRTLLGAN